MTTLRKLAILSFLALASAFTASAQCGPAGHLIFNALTGKYDCTANAGAGTGTVTSVGLAGTSYQITVTGATPVTASGSWTLSLPSGLVFPGTVSFAAGTTGAPSLTIPSGVAPTSPTTGQFWNLSGVLQYHDGTATRSLLHNNTAAGGDASGTFGSLVVSKLNGGSFPTSAVVVGSDGSAKPVAATTTGSGTTVPLATSPVLTTPRVTTINDANGNPFVISSATASAVDSITVTNAATANPATVAVSGTGSDANISLNMVSKGSGTVQCNGNPCVSAAAGLTSNLPVIGGNNAAVAVGTASGNTTQFVTTTGAQTSTAVTKIDASGNHIASGCTIDASNNLSCPGSITSGAASGKTGYTSWSGATSGAEGFTVLDVAGTSTLYVIPAAVSSGSFLKDNGPTTCQTLPSGAPANCEALAWASPAGSGTVNSGTAGQMAYYATSTTAVSGNANATISAGALTLGQAGSVGGSVVFSGSGSGTTTVTAGSAAGGGLTLPTATGTLVEDGATLTAGGFLYGGGNHVAAATGAGTAKQIALSGGAGAPTMIDFPEHLIIPAANCNNATAGAGWNLPASNAPTAACRAGTNNLDGVLQWANNNTTTNAQFSIQLPNDWDTATQPYVNIYYGSGANTSGTVKWTFSSACTKPDGSITDDAAFNAESTTTGKTMAAANRMWAESQQFTAVTSGNNCVVGSNMLVKITSGNGTATSTVNVSKVTVTIPRLLTVQAN